MAHVFNVGTAPTTFKSHRDDEAGQRCTPADAERPRVFSHPFGTRSSRTSALQKSLNVSELPLLLHRFVTNPVQITIIELDIYGIQHDYGFGAGDEWRAAIVHVV